MKINDIDVILERKPIKNMYLKVLPPDGNVKITAPLNMPESRIIEFIQSKYEWILICRQKFENVQNVNIIEFKSGEKHYLWGKPYDLEVIEGKKTGVELAENKIIMYTARNSTIEKRQFQMNEWYRYNMKNTVPSILNECIEITRKAPDEWRIKNMKTRWGTCNIRDRRIWLNLQLAQKPIECLKYVIIHELVHFYEKNHTERFKSLMDRFCPDWRKIKKRLNS